MFDHRGHRWPWQPGQQRKVSLKSKRRIVEWFTTWILGDSSFSFSSPYCIRASRRASILWRIWGQCFHWFLGGKLQHQLCRLMWLIQQSSSGNFGWTFWWTIDQYRMWGEKSPSRNRAWRNLKWCTRMSGRHRLFDNRPCNWQVPKKKVKCKKTPTYTTNFRTSDAFAHSKRYILGYSCELKILTNSIQS